MTTQEAAAALGISRRRVRHLIKAGRLQAETRIERGLTVYEIDPANLQAVQARPVGYPKGKPRVTVAE